MLTVNHGWAFRFDMDSEGPDGTVFEILQSSQIRNKSSLNQSAQFNVKLPEGYKLDGSIVYSPDDLDQTSIKMTKLGFARLQ